MDRFLNRSLLDISIYEHFDILYVKDKFPDADTALSTRLGKLVSRRRQLLAAEIDKPPAPSTQAASAVVQPLMAGGIADAKPPLTSSVAEVTSPPSASNLMSPTTSPQPNSPGTSPAGSVSTTALSFPFHEKRNTVIRRRAAPPLLRTARALYDVEPDEEEDNDDELAFKEGDILEITAKSAELEAEGWCKARIKGTRKVGLAPMEYLEMIAPAPQPRSARDRHLLTGDTEEKKPGENRSHPASNPDNDNVAKDKPKIRNVPTVTLSQVMASRKTAMTRSTVLQQPSADDNGALEAPLVPQSEYTPSRASSYGAKLRVEVPDRPRGANGEELDDFKCPYCSVVCHIESHDRWK